MTIIIKPLMFWFIFATQLESENDKLTSDILKKREKLAETEAQLVEATKDLREARTLSLLLFFRKHEGEKDKDHKSFNLGFFSFYIQILNQKLPNIITVVLTGSRILHRKPLQQAARTMRIYSQQHAELNHTVHDLYLVLF